MARYLVLDKSLYDQDGLISLFRGDDWSLPGKVMDINLNYSKEADLSDLLGATGYFPAVTGNPIACTVTVLSSVAGDVKLTLPASGTPLVAASNAVPVGFYLVLKHPSSVETVRTTDEALNVMDPSFPTG